MFKKGTIVLVPFPFTDLSGAKVRPAVVVSHKLSGDDVVVAFISTQHSRVERYDVRVIPSLSNGLKSASTIKCAKLATLDKKIILGELGELSRADFIKVSQKFQTLFGWLK
jgi:mRNA interferase MazF